MDKCEEVSIASPGIGEDEIEAVERVLRSGMLAQGAVVKEFEEVFASYIGARCAVAVSSGTAALHVALLACGVRQDDEVITTPFTFIATVNAILFCGAKPVLVDIDTKTFNIDVDLIEAKITPATKAILPVHLYGQPCDMDPIIDLCQKYDLMLIEDACQALGAEYGGSKVGSFGVGCFSFYPTKAITTGEGGMITTDDAGVAEKARMIRDHGQKERYIHEMVGYNYRMTDMAAAIGIWQLGKLDHFNAKRIDNAECLTGALSGTEGVIPPSVQAKSRHVYHQYTLRITDSFGVSRDELRRILKQAGISTGVYYPIPVHKQPAHRQFGDDPNLAVSEKLGHQVLSLPVHPNVTKENLQRMLYVIQGV